MTVGRLLAEMDSVEFTEWMAYFKIEKERINKTKAGIRDDATPVEDKIKNAFRFKGQK